MGKDVIRQVRVEAGAQRLPSEKRPLEEMVSPTGLIEENADSGKGTEETGVGSEIITHPEAKVLTDHIRSIE